MRQKTKVYLDTSVLSALFDNSNPQRQFFTQRFFDKIDSFNVYISEVVLAEIDNTRDTLLRGKSREEAIRFDILPVDVESRELADEYVNKGAIPPAYIADALHISIATVNGISYLLSWNFEHIVKVKTRRIINLVNASLEYPNLEILTPAELI